MNINVKSSVRDYSIEFSSSVNKIATAYKSDILIVDAEVYRLHKKSFHPTKKLILIKANEQAKEFASLQIVINKVLAFGIKKDERLVAVGGGVVQDIAGFIASILFRGIEWVFYPTTLVAQADSCMGGKTSINVSGTKNILGTFYPPSAVYIRPDFLKTLPVNEIKSGVGEILHYYMIFSDKKNLIKIKSDYAKLLSADEGVLHYHINNSLRHKLKYVEGDEFDKGKRNLYNYGHTFGHAIESISNFKIAHGIAVTIGMDLANYIAYCNELITYYDYLVLHNYIEFNMVKYKIPDIDKYVALLAQDKKNTSNYITTISPVTRIATLRFVLFNTTDIKKLKKQITQWINFIASN